MFDVSFWIIYLLLAPPKVRNLRVYSRNGDFISLRWLAPYPPHGTLEYYEIASCYYYYTYSCTNSQYERVCPVPCSLWDEDGYLCLNITNTRASYNYKISVSTYVHIRYMALHSFKNSIRFELEIICSYTAYIHILNFIIS